MHGRRRDNRPTTPAEAPLIRQRIASAKRDPVEYQTDSRISDRQSKIRQRRSSATRQSNIRQRRSSATRQSNIRQRRSSATRLSNIRQRRSSATEPSQRHSFLYELINDFKFPRSSYHSLVSHPQSKLQANLLCVLLTWMCWFR